MSTLGTRHGPGAPLTGDDLEALMRLLAVKSAGLGPIVPQPSALQGTLLLDPQNITGVASPSGVNTATVNGSTGRVFSSYLALAGAWGTISPMITQPTSVIGVSSHVDNTDPIVWRPFLGRNVSCSLQGTTPTVVAGVSLSSVTGKNRSVGANSLLQANLGASATVAQMVQNTTHASRSWVYKNVAGNVFALTQPLAVAPVPGSSVLSEVNTTADTDSANLLQPIALNVVAYEPVVMDGSGNNRAYLYQLTGLDPAGVGANTMLLGDVRCVECDLQRYIISTSGGVTLRGPIFTNCIFGGGGDFLGECTIFAGALMPTSSQLVISGGTIGGCVIDGDFIFGLNTTLFLTSSAQFGFIFIDNGALVIVLSGLLQCATLAYGGHVWYGAGTGNVNVQGTSHVMLNGGTFVGSFTAPALVTGIVLNSSATASSHTGASPDVINSGIATTPAHLDASPAGVAAFAGNAFNLGGSSVSTFE